MDTPVLVEAPSAKPVSLDEAKAALDISYSDKDSLIQGLIDGMTAWLDGWEGSLCGRCLCEQTWREKFTQFSTCMRLALLPVISAQITYVGSDGGERSVDDADFTIRQDELGAFIEFNSSFSTPSLSSAELRPITIEYVAGYEEDGEVPIPANVKSGILLLVRMLFDNPSGVVIGATVEGLPMGPRALLMPAVRMRV